MIKGHGDDIYKYPELKGNFSSNVYHEGTNEGLVNHLCSKMCELHHYPEPNADSLAEVIAQKMEVTPEQVLVTNGATEAFYLLAEKFRNAHSLIFTPSFAEYQDACKSAAHSISYVKNIASKERSLEGFDMVWLCNPNNPDAYCFDRQWLLQKITNHPSITFVIDEAYIDFIEGVESCISLIEEYPNLVVIRSMTKRYAIPALRLGYVVANKNMIEKLSQSLMPWRLNTLAIEAGKYVLSSDYCDDFKCDGLIRSCQQLQHELSKIDGLEVFASGSTFILIKSTMKAADLKGILVRDYALLIRDASNFRGLSDYHFRIATQRESENTLLISALKEIFKA